MGTAVWFWLGKVKPSLQQTLNYKCFIFCQKYIFQLENKIAQGKINHDSVLKTQSLGELVFTHMKSLELK